MVYSEIALLVAILSIAVNLQQYRSYIEYSLTLCHRGSVLRLMQEIHMQAQCSNWYDMSSPVAEW